MLQEVTSEAHPEHVPGNGPEQDYFSPSLVGHASGKESLRRFWQFCDAEDGVGDMYSQRILHAQQHFVRLASDGRPLMLRTP